MKKITSIFLVILIFIATFSIGYEVTYADSNCMAKGIYRSDIASGIGYAGPLLLSMYNNYSTSYSVDASETTFKNALRTSDVLFIQAHGNSGLIALKDSVIITRVNIINYNVTSQTKLAYLSACKSGNTSSVQGDLCGALLSAGVSTVVAFTGTISGGSNSSGGIHMFNYNAAYYMASGNTISQALAHALTDLGAATSSSCGADTYTIRGYSSLTL